jgi:ribonuclease T2
VSSIPSLRTVSKLAFTGASVLVGQSQRVLGGTLQTCLNPQLSCHNTTAVTDLCCFNAPGGQLLQTQFWDTAPVTGPVDSWTLHGLWYVLILDSNVRTWI